MISNGKSKISLEEFLQTRGISTNNFHLNEKSILLQKIINMKRYQKNNNYSKYLLNEIYMNQNTKRKTLNDRLIKKDNSYNNFNINNNQRKNTIYNNYISNFGNAIKPINLKKREKNQNENLSINYNYFNDTLRTGNKKTEKEYIFHTSPKPLDTSNESILNRINRTNNEKYNNIGLNSFRHFQTSFKRSNNKFNDIIHRTDKKFIYKKKLQNDKFKKKPHVSRNRAALFLTGNNSKENSICNSIDFSIINRTSTNDKNYSLSKTSESFYILANRKMNKTFQNKNPIHTRNIKFLNHFIKYCYLYYIIIVKKFFNNLKKITLDIYSNNLSNLISNKKRLFEEFNQDDFDRETIKNKTSDNFFDGSNLSFISTNKKINKGFVYNRNKRIFNQNYQIKNLMNLLNNSRIENKNITNYENKKFAFDNEQEVNNSKRSPFFYGKNSNNIFSENDKINLSKSNIKSKNSDVKDNIIGFIQINNEINPFKIKNNNINFFNETKNQINEDEILSFRKKNSENNTNKSNPIINILNTNTTDNKLNIDMKYMSYSYAIKGSNKFNNNKLILENFCLQIVNNNSYNNKRIKKISLRVKNSRLIKEKEDYIDLNNNENRKKYLYSLSVIKEEDDEKYNNDSSFKRSNPFKKMEHYYNISNNSKLISKASIEKLIDGEKVINEEDIDYILNKSSSRYKCNSKKSQEIMVVSNFGSIMRNRINRKENAKSLIHGILILIKFFGSLCFKIRKYTYLKLKMNWKICRLITHIIRYGLKNEYKRIKMKKDAEV